MPPVVCCCRRHGLRLSTHPGAGRGRAWDAAQRALTVSSAAIGSSARRAAAVSASCSPGSMRKPGGGGSGPGGGDRRHLDGRRRRWPSPPARSSSPSAALDYVCSASAVRSAAPAIWSSAPATASTTATAVRSPPTGSSYPGWNNGPELAGRLDGLPASSPHRHLGQSTIDSRRSTTTSGCPRRGDRRQLGTTNLESVLSGATLDHPASTVRRRRTDYSAFGYPSPPRSTGATSSPDCSGTVRVAFDGADHHGLGVRYDGRPPPAVRGWSTTPTAPW